MIYVSFLFDNFLIIFYFDAMFSSSCCKHYSTKYIHIWVYCLFVSLSSYNPRVFFFGRDRLFKFFSADHSLSSNTSNNRCFIVPFIEMEIFLINYRYKLTHIILSILILYDPRTFVILNVSFFLTCL